MVRFSFLANFSKVLYFPNSMFKSRHPQLENWFASYSHASPVSLLMFLFESFMWVDALPLNAQINELSHIIQKQSINSTMTFPSGWRAGALGTTPIELYAVHWLVELPVRIAQHSVSYYMASNSKFEMGFFGFIKAWDPSSIERKRAFKHHWRMMIQSATLDTLFELSFGLISFGCCN